MWARTLAGLFVGLLLSISLTLNFSELAPLPKDTLLLIGYITGFLIWAGIITFFYCISTIKKTLLISLSVLLLSATTNWVLL